MSYKTILLHLNDERRVARLVEAAIQVSSGTPAHVIGLYVVPPVPTHGATSYGAGMVETFLDSFRQEAERVRATFERLTAGLPLACEWRLIEPGGREVAEVVSDHARSVDLIIASQRDRQWDLSSLLDVPDRLILESGRPVLLVPHAGRFASIGSRVTVAWNGRKEAARATFDALPLLKTAQRVRILSIDPHKQAGSGDFPTAEIAAALARHDVTCTAATATAADLAVGDVLLSGLTDDATDLLVMGAYGHSRLREFVFGGATRHILEHMTVPVLMSH